MKVFIGGELEQSISDKFRKARNSVIESMNNCLYDISFIDEVSFYVFCMKGFITNPVNRYSKKRNRIELEILLSYDRFEAANEPQCINLLKQSIFDAIENYKNKNIPQQYINEIIERIKISIND